MGLYTLCIKEKFDGAHFLEGYKGACANMHGHTWRVESMFEGKKLDKLGMVVDFKRLKREVMKIVGQLDHHCANYVLPNDVNPTAENIAKWIYDQLKSAIKDYPITLKAVVVWESDNAWAAYHD